MIVRYDSFTNKIIFPTRIASGILNSFAGALKQWQLRRPGSFIIFDFSKVTKAFANGMLGIIAVVADLRLKGVELTIILPDNHAAKTFFYTTNWANLLDPQFHKNKHSYRKHFVQQFASYEELPAVANNFMDIIIGHIQMPRDILSALEWSVSEICDNVINHSISEPGGFLQVIAYPQKNLIAFTVADAGRGILNSLKEGIPNLNSDLQAIEESIKTGVTRNKKFGQGNGMAGTLRITTMTGGSLDIMSGDGRIVLTKVGNQRLEAGVEKQYPGTCVSGQIIIDHQFSVAEALKFGPFVHEPSTIVDHKYELVDQDVLLVRMSEQPVGTGTRAAGADMRTKIINLMTSKPNYPIIIDWESITVIASSFADEFLGKLYITIGKESFDKIIKNTNLLPLVSQIINKSIIERISA